MLYVKVSNGSVQFPYTIGQLRKDNPNTSFPAYITEATLANYSVFPVAEVAAPVVNPLTQRHEQATYRQQLRNVPQQESFPFNVVWPTQS